MSTLPIRQARPEDHAALEELGRRASLANERYREQLLAHPEVMELPPELILDGKVYMAEASGKLLGFAALCEEAEGEWDLHGLFVEPHYWRLGIGRALVAHCVEAARDLSTRPLQVICDEETLPFYEKCGFEQTGLASTQFGQALLMEHREGG